jgi:hypothetical protein
VKNCVCHIPEGSGAITDVPEIHDDATAFSLSLDRVTSYAQGLKVAGIEEQSGFALMGHHMVNVMGGVDLIEAPATLTQ